MGKARCQLEKTWSLALGQLFGLVSACTHIYPQAHTCTSRCTCIYTTPVVVDWILYNHNWKVPFQESGSACKALVKHRRPLVRILRVHGNLGPECLLRDGTKDRGMPGNLAHQLAKCTQQRTAKRPHLRQGGRWGWTAEANLHRHTMAKARPHSHVHMHTHVHTQ